MTEIKSFILGHKRATIAAGCVVVLLLGFLAAVLVNRRSATPALRRSRP